MMVRAGDDHYTEQNVYLQLHQVMFSLWEKDTAGKDLDAFRQTDRLYCCVYETSSVFSRYSYLIFAGRQAASRQV